jgi:hypothetical protein
MAWIVREDWDPAEAPDIYFTRAYMDSYRSGVSRALLFEYAVSAQTFRLPYLESPVAAYFPEAGAAWKDMETAYGYGGCWSTTRDPAFLAAAMRGLEECCRERRILAGFLRFHPLLANHDLAPGFQIVRERETVCVDLTDADPWNNQVSQKNRNMIRKAEREGVEFQVDREFRGLEAFTRLYGETMERLGAHASYRFGAAYFQGLPAALGKGSFLVHSLRGGETLASAIIMTWGKWGHYHLSASRREFQKLAPNNLMLYRTMLALKEMGCERFHLGGGLGPDPEDPLFKFKKAFSPRTLEFHIGKKVFFAEEYEALHREWAAKDPRRAAAPPRVLFYRF